MCNIKTVFILGECLMQLIIIIFILYTPLDLFYFLRSDGMQIKKKSNNKILILLKIIPNL